MSARFLVTTGLPVPRMQRDLATPLIRRVMAHPLAVCRDVIGGSLAVVFCGAGPFVTWSAGRALQYRKRCGPDERQATMGVQRAKHFWCGATPGRYTLD